MKAFKNKKMKTILLSGAMALVAVASLALGVSFMKPVNANAATLLPTDYRTDGASVRVMTINEEGEYEEAAKKGIRFHVEMGANYKVPNTDTLLLDTNATNSNGSYKMAEGYKTYTLAIPTRLLNGELTVNTPTVKKIDTTNYWFSDLNGNWESVAYIHSFPVEYYTDDLSFRGIICKVEGDTETVVASTETEERSLTGVAKKAYIDTIDENSIYWGTAENDTKVAPILKDFIPTYTVDYGAGVTEEVMWGDKLTKADANKNYYDETNCEPVEVELPLTYPVSTDIKIAETKEGKFVFTGVQYTTNGFNVFTTLPATAFTQDSVLSPSALDMKLGSGEALTANSVKVHIDGAGDGAKVLLVVEFDYEDISYGESLTILNSSHFYNDGYFYEVEQDYTFVFYNAAWELALGTISLGDIESIKNYTETVNGVEEKNIRITFRNDILVNGAVTIGTTNGNGGIIIERAEDDYATVVEITDGYYYWNQGQNMILELPGTSDIWGEAEDDILTIAEGTRLYQNNGYYVVESDIYAFYDGAEDWWFELDERSANATAFSSAKTFQEGNSIYVDVFTKLAWGNKAINVVSNDGVITYHNKNNVTSYVPSKVVYHGEGGYNALRIHIEAKSELGDWITIPKNTELWIGSTKMTILEDLTFYYLGVDGGNWVLNPTFNEVGRDDFVSIYWSGNNIRYDTKEIWSTLANNRVIMDDTYIEGDGVILEGSVYSKFYYYGGSNNVFEMQGVNFSAEGGTATLKAGVVFWLLSNTDSSLTGAYRLTEDIILEVAGANGSQIYQDVELASISSANIASVTNDSENGGEIRFNLKGTLFSKVYSSGNLEGSATLNGAKTSTGYVYGGDGTSGYTGNSIISFTSTGFGAPFQATNPGDRVVIEAGTKIWLNSGSGYVTIADTWDYTWTGEKFVPTAPEGTKYTVTVNATNATVEMLTDATVAIGGSVRFNVTANEGFAITGVPGATENGDGTYTVSNIYENKVINVKAAVRLDASSIERFYTYIGKGEDKFVGIRVEIKDTAALRMLPENYGGTLMAGEVTIAANGATVTPTSYQSYGPNNLLLGFVCDQVANMVDGDEMTIKAGTIIKYDNVEMYVAEDITCMVKGSGFVQTGVEYTINFNISNASITENGMTVTSIKVMAGNDATFSVVADSGYVVVNVVGATKNDDGSYTVSEVYADTTVTITVVKIVNIGQSDVIGIINNGGTEIRLQLNKERADISAINGEYYWINFSGTIALTINGSSVTPTQYNYYGVIGDTNHQLLGIVCDVASMKAGDSLTIKAGSIFAFAGGSLYATEDITIKMVGLTIKYNDSLGNVYVDSVAVSNGTTVSKFAPYTALVGFGWSGSNDKQYKLTSVLINGVEAGTTGTYTVTLTQNTTVEYKFEQMSAEDKKIAILNTINADLEKYTGNTLKLLDSGNLGSTQAMSTVTFNDAFFDLLAEYGYSKISFKISTSNSNASVVKGTEAGGYQTSTIGSNSTQTISSAQSYTARTYSWFNYSKTNVDWTLSDISFS